MLVRGARWGLFVVCSLVLSVAAQTGPPIAILIGCGSTEDSSSPKGTRWLKDFGYTGGKTARIDVYNALAPQLRTVRYFEMSDGPENCYNISVQNGHYLVRFVFAYGSVDNSYLEPQFDVSLEATLVYTFNRHGWTMERSLSYAESLVHIDDGAVTGCFHSLGHGNPSISSVEIRQIRDQAYDLGSAWSQHIILKMIKRINCGVSITGYDSDYKGDAWGGDRYWVHDGNLDKGQTSSIRTSASINGTSVAPNFYPEIIYQTASAGTFGASLSYNFQVDPNQNYSLFFHFAEISPNISSKEQRVFDILVNKQVVFRDVDIVSLAGAKFTALVLNTTVFVQGRTLSITYRPLQGTPLVSAFEIYQVIRTEYTTEPREVWALQALKNAMALPPRVGWNGDPCVPQEHPWNGLTCGFDLDQHSWFIDGMDLDYQGLKGYLPKDLSFLNKLQVINISGNSIYGQLPPELGNLTDLIILDFSYNKFNGSIPATFATLSRLRKLYLNSNQLSGPVPPMLLARTIRGASFNFSDNSDLCGVPGLKSCGFRMSGGAKVGIAFATFAVTAFAVTFALCCWKRRLNIARSRLSTTRSSAYAKSRTNFTRDLQLSKMNRIDDLGSPYRDKEEAP